MSTVNINYSSTLSSHYQLQNLYSQFANTYKIMLRWALHHQVEVLIKRLELFRTAIRLSFELQYYATGYISSVA